MKRKPKAARPPDRVTPDRWATLNWFTHDELAGFVADTRSPAAGLLWYVLFTLANGKDGTVRGASVSRLARITGMDRHTVRAALKRLVEAKAVSVHASGAVPVYLLQHVAKGGGE